ncbi:MAG: hypothetical protein MUC63_09660 [Planctomycetes bacterium]|jgi:hypothetical protein|nr:hypothetical protein [Planctomycetota bacterium]
MNRSIGTVSVVGLFCLTITCAAVAEEDGAGRAPGLEESLKAALKGATRVRLRSGCVCCTGKERAEARFSRVEEWDPGGVHRLVGAIRIAEPEPGSCFAHACCGDGRVFEFYRDDELLAAFSFDHESDLRWRGWSTDARLTEESAAALAGWLAEHGIRGLKEEKVRLETAHRVRAENSRKIVPESLIEPLAACRAWTGWFRPGYMDHGAHSEESADACRLCVEKALADPQARSRMVLRLYGVDEASWRHRFGFDDVLEKALLPSIGKPQLAQAIRDLRSDPQGLDGAARWLLGKGNWAALEEKDLRALLPDLAGRALGHPHADNRHLSIAALQTIGGEEAVRLLRDVLAGRIGVRGPPLDDLGLPAEGFPVPVVSSPRGCSERAHAALALSRLGDKESLAAIRELAKAATGPDRRAFAEVEERLGR